MCNLHWCYTFCTGVTLFALVLQLNCTALSQSESSNFFMYIIIVKNFLFPESLGEFFYNLSKNYQMACKLSANTRKDDLVRCFSGSKTARKI